MFSRAGMIMAAGVLARALRANVLAPVWPTEAAVRRAPGWGPHQAGKVKVAAAAATGGRALRPRTAERPSSSSRLIGRRSSSERSSAKGYAPEMQFARAGVRNRTNISPRRSAAIRPQDGSRFLPMEPDPKASAGACSARWMWAPAPRFFECAKIYVEDIESKVDSRELRQDRPEPSCSSTRRGVEARRG